MMKMTKYDRLLFVLNLLRSRRSLNASHLAEECGVTERTIYRDIISLSESSIPIYFDRGYKLASGNFLPPLNFTFEEYSCLKLALESSPLGKSGVNETIIKTIKAKIEAGLSDTTIQQKRIALDTAHIDIDISQSEKNSAKFYSDIETAINEQRCLELDYESIESGHQTRDVEPYFIIFKGRAFYFVAFCRLRKEFRTFRLDRINRLDITDRTFKRQRGINPTNYFDGSWRLFSGDPVKVTVKFSGKSARVIQRATHHPKEKKFKEDDGRINYTVTVNGIEEIKHWLLGFGGDVEVISPESLREELNAIGQAINRLYSKD